MSRGPPSPGWRAMLPGRCRSSVDIRTRRSLLTSTTGEDDPNPVPAPTIASDDRGTDVPSHDADELVPSLKTGTERVRTYSLSARRVDIGPGDGRSSRRERVLVPLGRDVVVEVGACGVEIDAQRLEPAVLGDPEPLDQRSTSSRRPGRNDDARPRSALPLCPSSAWVISGLQRGQIPATEVPASAGLPTSSTKRSASRSSDSKMLRIRPEPRRAASSERSARGTAGRLAANRLLNEAAACLGQSTARAAARAACDVAFGDGLHQLGAEIDRTR